MFMLLQICMTVFAAARGWKWFALLPIACTLLIGFVIGFVGALLGTAGVLDTMPLWAWISIDAFAALVLVVMVVVGKDRRALWDFTKHTA